MESFVSLIDLFPKQALAYGVLTFDKGRLRWGRISEKEIAAVLNFCRRFIDIAEIIVVVAARGRSPASKVYS